MLGVNRAARSLRGFSTLRNLSTLRAAPARTPSVPQSQVRCFAKAPSGRFQNTK